MKIEQNLMKTQVTKIRIMNAPSKIIQLRYARAQQCSHLHKSNIQKKNPKVGLKHSEQFLHLYFILLSYAIQISLFRQIKYLLYNFNAQMGILVFCFQNCSDLL